MTDLLSIVLTIVIAGAFATLVIAAICKEDKDNEQKED